ncbi:hypothetical protein Ancab_017757 [Ancistrocladus abbreviatus]
MASVLQADEFFCNRILSRQSTVGCSSRIYYRNSDGVPFKWEQQPGKPIDPPTEDAIPPLSPPPAVLSLGLPKPCIDELKAPKRRRAWLWKKIKRKMRWSSGDDKSKIGSSDHYNESGSKFWELEGWTEASPHNSSSSLSLSSSSSSFHTPSFQPSTYHDPKKGWLHRPITCSPMNFGDMIVCLVKRV